MSDGALGREAAATRVGLGAAAFAIVIGALAAATLARDGRGRPFLSGNDAELAAFVATFLLGFASSAAADLDRPRPRLGLAALTGAVFVVAVIVYWALSLPEVGPPLTFLAVPAAGALPFAVRAWMHEPPLTYAALERWLGWIFTGAFWASAIAIAAKFGLKNTSHVVAKVALVGASGLVFGLVCTAAMLRLSGEREDPEPGAPGAAGGGGADARATSRRGR